MSEDYLSPTPILDFEEPVIQRFLQELGSEGSDEEFLRRAHQQMCAHTKAVYSVRETQPASRTLEQKKGSCSQRLALFEALARAHRIATRVRALFVSGRFWYPRFPFAKPFSPARILLLWPQFLLRGEWRDFEEIYQPIAAYDLSRRFTNTGESLFEAITETPIDFFGKGCQGDCQSNADLRGFLLEEKGPFATRDEALRVLGNFEVTLRGRCFELFFGGRPAN